MRSKSILVVVILFAVPHSAFAGYLYGANASNSTLYQIDSADGSKVLVANLGIDVRGLAYNIS
ncbi:MAG TPA: hypothetical protein HPP66_11350, partial [Planctomycetes bacterium]|nr:hypothetical protein [Planctomycetota bacterium]